MGTTEGRSDPVAILARLAEPDSTYTTPDFARNNFFVDGVQPINTKAGRSDLGDWKRTADRLTPRTPRATILTRLIETAGVQLDEHAQAYIQQKDEELTAAEKDKTASPEIDVHLPADATLSRLLDDLDQYQFDRYNNTMEATVWSVRRLGNYLVSEAAASMDLPESA